MAESPLLLLRRFFSFKSAQGELSIPEFTQFVKSLSEEEKERFKAEVISWDGNSTFIPLDLTPATGSSSAVTVAA